jgi:hypothetical protein
MEKQCSSLFTTLKKNRYFMNKSTSILAGIMAAGSLLCGFNAPAIAGDSIAASVSIDFKKDGSGINTASSAIAIGKQNAFAITAASEQSSSGYASASAGYLLIQGLSANGSSYYVGAEYSGNNAPSGTNVLLGNSIDGNAAVTTSP